MQIKILFSSIFLLSQFFCLAQTISYTNDFFKDNSNKWDLITFPSKVETKITNNRLVVNNLDGNSWFFVPRSNKPIWNKEIESIFISSTFDFKPSQTSSTFGIILLVKEFKNEKDNVFNIYSSVNIIVSKDSLFILANEIIPVSSYKISLKNGSNKLDIKIDNKLEKPMKLVLNDKLIGALPFGSTFFDNIGVFSKGKGTASLSNFLVQYSLSKTPIKLQNNLSEETLRISLEVDAISNIPLYVGELLNKYSSSDINLEQNFLSNALSDTRIKFLNEEPIISSDGKAKVYQLSYIDKQFNIAFNNVKFGKYLPGHFLVSLTILNKKEYESFFFRELVKLYGFVQSDINTDRYFKTDDEGFSQMAAIDKEHQLYLVLFDLSLLSKKSNK